MSLSNGCNVTLLADVWSRFEPGVVGWVICSIVGAAIAWAAIMAGLNGTRQFFGRRPPFDEELAQHRASVAQLKSELAKLPNEEKFNKLAEQLGGLATGKQLAALEVAMDQQIKDVRAYAHKAAHDTREDINPRLLNLEQNFMERGEKLAAVEADVKTLTRIVTNFDGKLDRLIRESGELRGRTERNT